VDRRKGGRAARHRDDRTSETSGETTEVDDVEPSDDRAVQEHRAHAGELGQRPHEGGDAVRRVGAVDADPSERDALDDVGRRPGDGGDRRERVTATEGAVVDGGDAQVRFAERAP